MILYFIDHSEPFLITVNVLIQINLNDWKKKHVQFRFRFKLFFLKKFYTSFWSLDNDDDDVNDYDDEDNEDEDEHNNDDGGGDDEVWLLTFLLFYQVNQEVWFWKQDCELANLLNQSSHKKKNNKFYKSDDHKFDEYWWWHFINKYNYYYYFCCFQEQKRLLRPIDQSRK